MKPILVVVTYVHFRVVDQAAATMADPHEYNMSGVKVKFPHKAYPSQVGLKCVFIALSWNQNAGCNDV